MRNDEYRLCSVVSRESGDDPAGSAGAFHAALLVEVAPPWGQDISRSRRFPDGLRDVLATAQQAGLFQKFTAFMPEKDRSVAGHTRVFRFSRPDTGMDAGAFSRYEKAEFLIPDAELSSSFGGIFSGSHEYAVEENRDAREVFVCVHNNRDVCCGRFGTELHRALKEVESRELRLWRCSHLGGHRFAPTMMDFPTGTVWGHANPQTAASLVRHEMDPAEAGRLYRGWPGLASRYEQISDREILTREGWGWLDTPRSGKVTDLDPDSDTAEVEISTPHFTYTATVEPDGSVMTLVSSGTEPLIKARQYQVEAHRKP